MMSPTMLVRPVAASDYGGWLPLWTAYNAFYGRANDTALPEEITRATWSRFFDASEPVWALVAEREGRIAGIVHYIFHRSTIALAPTCYLQDLFTADEARKTGIGRALIEAVYERAQSASAPAVYWHTQTSNATARSLYDTVANDSGFLVYRKRF